MSGINGVNSSYTDAYSNYNTATAKTKQTEGTEQTTQAGVVYEPSEEGKAAASKMDRSAIIAQLQADTEARVEQMTNLVRQMMSQQGATFGKTDDMWRFLADGNFTVDAATKAQAQKDIADDGYWGVEQTSQRIFEFAKALTGGDADKMEEMRAAFEKGFKMATETWGKELPDISQRTYDATEKLFDDYAASLKASVEE
ncbi:MAG: hypothetical protein ACI4AA_05825 [Lachnospiraceae bacterium]